MTRICLLAFWIFSTLILFPCTSVDAKESEVRIYLDYVMPIFGDADGKAKAIVGLTFKNLTSNKLLIPFIAAPGKGRNYRDLGYSELPYSILVNGQTQTFGTCAAITCEWVDSKSVTVSKSRFSFPHERLMLPAGDAETLQFVAYLPNQPGNYKLKIDFDNQALWEICMQSNSRIIDSKLNGQSVFFKDSTSTDIELKSIKASSQKY